MKMFFRISLFLMSITALFLTFGACDSEIETDTTAETVSLDVSVTETHHEPQESELSSESSQIVSSEIALSSAPAPSSQVADTVTSSELSAAPVLASSETAVIHIPSSVPENVSSAVTSSVDESPEINAPELKQFRNVEEMYQYGEYKASLDMLCRMYENYGVPLKIEAVGNSLVYQFNVSSELLNGSTEEDLRKSISGQENMFKSLASAMEMRVTEENPSVVIKFVDENGELAASFEYFAQ